METIFETAEVTLENQKLRLLADHLSRELADFVAYAEERPEAPRTLRARWLLVNYAHWQQDPEDVRASAFFDQLAG